MNRQRLEEQLECPICMDRFQAPRQLPCQHTFCLVCLQRLDATRGMLRCPECRAEHQIPAVGVDGFPTAIAIQRLLEAMTLPNEPQVSEGVIQGPRSSATVFPRPNQSNFGQVSNIRRQQQSGNQRRQQDVVLTPTVNPQHQNTQHRNSEEDIELQIALEMSAVEIEQRQSRPHSISTSRERSNQVTTNRTAQRHDPVEQSSQNVFQKGRKYIRLVLSRILNSHQVILISAVAIYSVITFSRFVAGAAKVGSDCPLERKVAVYLFVKSWFAILFWGVLILWLFQSTLARALDNPFVEVYLVLETLFSLIWLFIGTAWVMGNFYEIKISCPNYIWDWNQHFINFALFLTVVDYICLVAFLFYSGYTICEPEEENNQNA